ncbi:MAG: hypothetical protein DI568_05740 [Sphingomonas sp.]|nr:MAG: hypothetical protein DI568_05740 [Sphingomonas sp.]
MLKRIFVILSPALFFWIIALDLLNGFPVLMKPGKTGFKAALLRAIATGVDVTLVGPLGAPLAAGVLFVMGAVAAWGMMRFLNAAQRAGSIPQNRAQNAVGSQPGSATNAKPSAADLKLRNEFIQRQLETFAVEQRPWDADRPVARLTPIVPIRFDDTDSWFGGKPKLPRETPWPQMGDTPLRFLCQINLASLPKGLWSGIGPREGWLAIFLHPETAEPAALHFKGEIEEQNGPGQIGASWASWYEKEAAFSGDEQLPRWPVKIEEGRQDSLGAGQIGDVWSGFQPNLENPEMQPFDENSLSSLLKIMEDFFAKQAEIMNHLSYSVNSYPENIELLNNSKKISQNSLNEFRKLNKLISTYTTNFNEEKLSIFYNKINNIKYYSYELIGRDENNYENFNISHYFLRDVPERSSSIQNWWWRPYSSQLYWHILNAYTQNPARLRPEMRNRMETIWNQDAKCFYGAMGHAPLGFVDTPLGPDTNTEVLLELATSKMQGWIWGDLCTIVLTIDRDALARGDFSQLEMEITN